MLKIVINGFGRIGRTIARINAIKKKYELVAINDINPYVDNMAYLFKYDATYGKFEGEVRNNSKDSIVINGKESIYFSEKNIENIDWASTRADVLIDATGVTSNVIEAKELVKKGHISKVVVTHSSDHVDSEIVLGVNDNVLNSDDKVISSSICDANAISHILKWIDEVFEIETGSVTTLHPWLSYQNLVDAPVLSQAKPGLVWKDYALGRASSNTVIPKNTTAVTAAEKIVPSIKGKLLAFSYRIPTDIVSSSDVVLKTKKCPNLKDLIVYIEQKINHSKYVRANYESLVSRDYKREEASVVIDMQWLNVKNGLIKIVAWYDNEWGYSCRVLDVVEKVMSVDYEGCIS